MYQLPSEFIKILYAGTGKEIKEWVWGPMGQICSNHEWKLHY